MKVIVTRNDKILIALLIAVALLSAVPVVAALGRRPPGNEAEIVVAGKRVGKVSLAGHRTLSVETSVGRERLQVSDGKIRVASTPCPRKICARQGWIWRTGEEIVCVPGEMIVRIAGGESPRVDAVSR